MSSVHFQAPSKDALPNVIAIPPSKSHFPPSPPLTPTTPGILLSSPIPISITPPSEETNPVPSASAAPPAPTAAQSYNLYAFTSSSFSSFHYPLTRHLALLHPNTPKEVIHFVATRLLSPDIPHGHEGEWAPVNQDVVDLSIAGIGKEAGKGCVQKKEGVGRKVDEKLEDMYGIARQSWKVLEMKLPGAGKV